MPTPPLINPQLQAPEEQPKADGGGEGGPRRSWSKPAGHAAYEHVWQINYQIQNGGGGWEQRQKRSKTYKSGQRCACVVLPSSGSLCSTARRCVLSWGASVKNRWGSWLGKSAFYRSAFSSPTASFAVPERKKASILGLCLSQDATWLAKSYSRPQLAFFPSFFYSPFSLSLVFTPSFARSRSISHSLPPAFSNLLLLSLVWYLSVQPLPSTPTSFSPPFFLGCVFLVATLVSLVWFSSVPRVGQALSSWPGNTLQDVSEEKITVFSTF